MTIKNLNAALARLHEESAGWWDDLSAEQRKQYIKDHPNSKYAKQSGGGKPAAKKAAAPKPAPANGHKAAAEKAHADLTKYESELKTLRAKHAPAFHKFNQLLDAAEREENPKKRAALEKRLDEMEKQPHIKKAIKLSNQKREAKKALSEAKKAAATAPAPSRGDKSNIAPGNRGGSGNWKGGGSSRVAPGNMGGSGAWRAPKGDNFTKVRKGGSGGMGDKLSEMEDRESRRGQSKPAAPKEPIEKTGWLSKVGPSKDKPVDKTKRIPELKAKIKTLRQQIQDKANPRAVTPAMRNKLSDMLAELKRLGGKDE